MYIRSVVCLFINTICKRSTIYRRSLINCSFRSRIILVITSSTEKACKILRPAEMSIPSSLLSAEQLHNGVQFLLQISSSETGTALCPPQIISTLHQGSFTPRFWSLLTRRDCLQPVSWKERCGCWETWVPIPQMGKQRGSTQQMVGAREGNKSRPHPPFLAAAFTEGEKESLASFRAMFWRSIMCSWSFLLKEGFARQLYAERPWHFMFLTLVQTQLMQAQPKQASRNPLLKFPFSPLHVLTLWPKRSD